METSRRLPVQIELFPGGSSNYLLEVSHQIKTTNSFRNFSIFIFFESVRRLRWLFIHKQNGSRALCEASEYDIQTPFFDESVRGLKMAEAMAIYTIWGNNNEAEKKWICTLWNRAGIFCTVNSERQRDGNPAFLKNKLATKRPHESLLLHLAFTAYTTTTAATPIYITVSRTKVNNKKKESKSRKS